MASSTTGRSATGYRLEGTGDVHDLVVARADAWALAHGSPERFERGGWRPILAPICACCLVASTAAGSTWHVPGDAPTIEGFTICNGRARGEQNVGSGGGVRCLRSSVVIRSCVIADCQAEQEGGGVFSWRGSLWMDACRVVGCSSGWPSGGVYAITGPLTMIDCELERNVAGTAEGGVVALYGEVAILRCVVSTNTAAWGAVGGIAIVSSPAFIIRDCLVTRNESHIELTGVGIWIDRDTPGRIESCTVAHNWGGDQGHWR